MCILGNIFGNTDIWHLLQENENVKWNKMEPKLETLKGKIYKRNTNSIDLAFLGLLFLTYFKRLARVEYYIKSGI